MIYDDDDDKNARIAEALAKISTVNADGSITVPLSSPIKVEGSEVAALTFTEPTGKHWHRLNIALWQQGDGAAQLKAIQVLGALPPSSTDQLKGRDIMKITMAISPFFNDSPATGGAA